MKKIFLTQEKKLRLLAATLMGISLGLMVWTLTLPSGFISKRGVVLAVACAILFTFLFYGYLLPFFIKNYRHFRFNWWIIVAILVLLTGIVFQKVVVRQSLVFPFMPKQTLKITSHSENLSIRPVECELVTLYSGNFEVVGDLERVNSLLMTLHGTETTISWTGWPGNVCKFTLVDPDAQSEVEVFWNGQQREIKDVPTGLSEYSLDLAFEVPLTTRLLIACILFVMVTTVVIILTCLFLQASNIPHTWEDTPQRAFQRWPGYVLIVLLTGLNLVLFLRVLSAANPYTHFPGRDQGVFLYIGEGLLKGQIPYLDTWDHKGPLIYFINALGKLFDPAGEWGVFFVVVIFLVAALGTIYFLLRKRVGKIPLLIGLAVFLGLMLQLCAFDNLVELYSMPFYALGLLTVVNTVEKKNLSSMLLFGVVAALAFSLRPNLISIFVAGGFFWLGKMIKIGRKFGRGVLLTFTGVMLVLIPTIIFFGLHGALTNLIDQVLKFNFVYSGNSTASLWIKITQIRSMVIPIVVIGLVAIFYLSGASFSGVARKNVNLVSVLTYSFFVELILSRISGYDFTHYSLPLLLISVLLLILFIDAFTLMAPKVTENVWNLLLQGICASIVLGLIVWQWNQFKSNSYESRNAEYLQAANLYQFHTRPTLLVWGAEVEVNYLTGIPSPSRYVYQYPLMNDAYCTPEMGQEFTNDIKTNLPVILDASHGNGWIVPLDAVKRKQAEATPHNYGSLACLNTFFDFFYQNYYPAYTMYGTHWTIYLPRSMDTP